ncbi:MAG: D-lactate dehydrogenase, partial [Xanthobacteraceae bacterium]
GNGPLPVSGEYIHREAFDMAARYGKDTVLAIRWLGTDRLPLLFRAKGWVDRLARRLRFLPSQCSDRLLQGCSRAFPQHLPERMRRYRDAYEHHLVLKVADDAIEPTEALLARMFPSRSGDAFACDPQEAERAMLHRFAVAGAAVRYRAVHPETVEDIVAIDLALRRDERDWFERLPESIESRLLAKLYYGHFFCHVFHQDYVVKKGVDPMALEHEILALLDARGAEYPAEHNVGHLYPAKPALAEHYRRLDPTNAMNPGIGGTSKLRHYA